MSLLKNDVSEVYDLCEAVAEVIGTLPPGCLQNNRYEGGRECAKLKRLSMDLRQALAAMRQPWRKRR